MIKALVIILVFLPSLCCGAETWYAKNPCTNNGDGTTASCAASPGAAGAFNSLDNIVWGSVGAGDNVYLIGTFDANLTIAAAGSAGSHITVRGDHVSGSGQIGTTISSHEVHLNNYITLYKLTIYGSISNKVISIYGPYNIQFIAETNEIRDYGQGAIAAGFSVGESVQINGSSNNDTLIYKIKTISAEASYDKIIVETDNAFWSVIDEAQVSARLYRFKIYHDVTIDGCTVIQVSAGTQLINFNSIPENIIVRNCDLNGNSMDVRGALYWYVTANWTRPNNILIDNNYIHDIGDGTYQEGEYDNHCIGIQASSNMTITNNHMERCAAAIVAYSYNDPGTTIDNLVIAYNLIEKMDGNNQNGQYPGSGIIIIGNVVCTLCDPPAEIHHNVIVAPFDCPETPNNSSCTGINYSWGVQGKIYSNTISGFADGIRLGSTADLQNNIISNSSRYHIAIPATVGDWTEDFNIFYPDTGTKFYKTPTAYNFTDYKTNHPQAGTNVNSSTADPLLTSIYHLGAGSPAIDTGTDWGQTKDKAGIGKIGSAWDIGAYEFFTGSAISFLLDSGHSITTGGSGSITISP